LSWGSHYAALAGLKLRTCELKRSSHFSLPNS
jgi:hypothetical protein